jgi:hypothetical protein
MCDAEIRSPGFPNSTIRFSGITRVTIYSQMMRKQRTSVLAGTLQILAEFRHPLRLFLHFSERVALRFGLQRQGHQLLLQIAGAPDKAAATIGYSAERRARRHNAVVELSNRCEKEARLTERRQAGSDYRAMLLELSFREHEKLEAFANDHTSELIELAPELIRTLNALRAVHKKPGNRATRRDSAI